MTNNITSGGEIIWGELSLTLSHEIFTLRVSLWQLIQTDEQIFNLFCVSNTFSFMSTSIILWVIQIKFHMSWFFCSVCWPSSREAETDLYCLLQRCKIMHKKIEWRWKKLKVKTPRPFRRSGINRCVRCRAPDCFLLRFRAKAWIIVRSIIAQNISLLLSLSLPGRGACACFIVTFEISLTVAWLRQTK